MCNTEDGGYDDMHQVCSDEGVLNINALVYADDGCLSIVTIPTTMPVVATLNIMYIDVLGLPAHW